MSTDREPSNALFSSLLSSREYHASSPPPKMGIESVAWMYWTLAFLVLVSYTHTLPYAFLSYDDQLYVAQQPRVRGGLTWPNIVWALTSVEYFYHPLTWLSLQLDATVFGIAAPGFRFTNLLLFLGIAFGFFKALLTVTSQPTPSLVIAALFVLHPLNAEAVVWISERKGLLATLCAIWSLLMYLRYLALGSVRNYYVSLLLFLLSLSAKPMAVGLPIYAAVTGFFLLSRSEALRNLRSLGPFMILAVLWTLLTFKAEAAVGAIAHNDATVIDKAARSAIYLGHYFRTAILPDRLFVPYCAIDFADRSASVWLWLFAIPLAVSRCVWLSITEKKLVVSLFSWWIFALAPVLTGVQIGIHGPADRYTLLALPGLIGAMVIALRPLIRYATAQWLVCIAALVLGLATNVQSRYWRDSSTLFEHTLMVDPNNFYAHFALGSSLHARGNLISARAHLERSIQRNPDYGPSVRALVWNLAQSREWGEIESVARRTRPRRLEARREYVDFLLRASERHSELRHLALEEAIALSAASPTGQSKLLASNAFLQAGLFSQAFEILRTVDAHVLSEAERRTYSFLLDQCSTRLLDTERLHSLYD